MKKLFLALAVLCSVFSASAQRAGDITAWNDNVVESDFNHSGFYLNPSIGVTVGDCETGFGVSTNFGYRWHIASGFSWDVVKLGFNADAINFTETFDARFMTGFRYNTPVLFSDKGMYADFAIGYHYCPDSEFGGVAY